MLETLSHSNNQPPISNFSSFPPLPPFRMLNYFFCGTFYPGGEEDTDQPLWSSSSSTPRRFRRTRHSKNPYSTRGLDKFSALLADLEEKRQKIYSQVGAHDISLVRFAYSSSNDCVPIVVKLRDQRPDAVRDDLPSAPAVAGHTLPVEAGERFRRSALGATDADAAKKKAPFSWMISAPDWRQPSSYLPAIVMFILLLLTVFGRSVVILCTCLGWYLVPVMKGGIRSSDAKRPKKKKIYVRRKSDRMVVSDSRSASPNTNRTREADVTSPELHGHRRSC